MADCAVIAGMNKATTRMIGEKHVDCMHVKLRKQGWKAATDSRSVGVMPGAVSQWFKIATRRLERLIATGRPAEGLV